MRIWDISPKKLCRFHLLAEHREIHALYSILLNNKKGYRNHPETKRWEGKLPALKKRHDLIVNEFNKRGYNHSTPLEKTAGSISQDKLITTKKEQEEILKYKNCQCLIE